MANQNAISGTPTIVETANGLKGVISAPTIYEEKPCFACRHWEKDTRKLMQFLNSNGLKADENGIFTTPIVGDFHDGRRSMQIDPRNFGFCRKLVMPSHMNATCADWDQVTLTSEMADRIR